MVQKLPMSYMRGASVHTFSEGIFTRVEDDLTEGMEPGVPAGYVNPTSFSELFLPADLPLPRAQPALGVCIANGVPRYIMPSMVLSLETPDRLWRNRGTCSLPRANIWIDAFATTSAPIISRLQLSAFGQNVPDVRFLEDIDGAASYVPLLTAAVNGAVLLRPQDPTSLPIAAALQSLKDALRSLQSSNPPLSAFFNDGYHLIDIPLGTQVPVLMQMPKLRIKMFLADFDNPARLLTVSDPTALDSEPLGELEVAMVPASPGRESDFLPKCYLDLYEKGNLVFTS